MKTSKPFIIALDGYSSCGKSTLAKELAKHYKFLYIDTGAMYRCTTLFFLEQGIDMSTLKDVEPLLDQIHIEFEVKGDNQIVKLNNREVTDLIREPRVSAWVSEVAAISSVRTKLVAQQKQYGKCESVVMDGRDIGTVVFPQADIKFFLTASEEIRANRRYLELVQKGIDTNLEDVLKNLHKRDFIDSTREDSPLTQAEDAIVLDNTEMDRAEQFRQACTHIDNKLGA